VTNVSLNEWLADGRLRRHESSIRESQDLLRIVERDLADAGLRRLSTDRRYATIYNAALQLATVVLRVSGYRPAGVGHHWLTFQALPHLLGMHEQPRADFFDACRRKRNAADYDAVGSIMPHEAAELLEEVLSFRRAVLAWLETRLPGAGGEFPR